MRQELSDSIRKLMSQAIEQGYVTYDALSAAMSADHYTSEEIEDAVSLLSSKGIAIVDGQSQGVDPKAGGTRGDVRPCCSFCEKGAGVAKRLIAGNKGYICYDCVSICMVVLAQQDRAQFEQQVEAARAFQPGDLIPDP